MKLLSIGRKSDFIISKHYAEVLHKENRIVVRSPNIPEYHWGNFIIFNQAPQKNDLENWTMQFRKDFPYYIEPTHYTFSWNPSAEFDMDSVKEFTDAGFSLETCEVLGASELVAPKTWNNNLNIRPLENDTDWTQALNCQISCRNSSINLESYRIFKEKQMDIYRTLQNNKHGYWFGAFLGSKLVADLGIFYDASWGRYQSVGTLPEYRNQGICKQLVYEAGSYALKKHHLEKLIIEADTDYHALSVYKKVGFKPLETNHSLSLSL